MSGLFLLVIGLIGLAVILAAFAYLGLKAWRLLKRGMRISRDAAPLAGQLAGQAGALALKAEGLAENGAQIAANLERMQVSAQRLQVVIEALREGAAPYLRLREYLGR